MSSAGLPNSDTGDVAGQPSARMVSSHTTTIHQSFPRPMIALCTCSIAAATVWSFWPVGNAAAPTPDLTPSINIEHKQQPLHLAAFQTPIWIAPTPAPAPPAPPPPPPPLKLQLIAITSGPSDQPDSRAALIYDPDQNKIFSVGPGDRIGDRVVLKITTAIVEIGDSAGSRLLSLKSGDGAFKP